MGFSEKEEKHESYGMIGVSRMFSGKENILFGSSIRHNTVMRLRIKPGKCIRSLNHDSYMSDGHSYIEVDMSVTQFAELISSINQGDGVPCTIARINNKSIDQPTMGSKREQFVNEFSESTDEVAKKLDGLLSFAKSLSSKQSVSKADRQALVHKIEMLRQDIESNLPFIAKMFNEQMDKTVDEAKGEVEGFIAQRTQELGLQNIRDLAGIGQSIQNQLPGNSE
jgi:hypothetical protein